MKISFASENFNGAITINGQAASKTTVTGGYTFLRLDVHQQRGRQRHRRAGPRLGWQHGARAPDCVWVQVNPARELPAVVVPVDVVFPVEQRGELVSCDDARQVVQVEDDGETFASAHNWLTLDTRSQTVTRAGDFTGQRYRITGWERCG